MLGQYELPGHLENMIGLRGGQTNPEAEMRLESIKKLSNYIEGSLQTNKSYFFMSVFPLYFVYYVFCCYNKIPEVSYIIKKRGLFHS